MTEKLVRNYTDSNAELERFHEQRLDVLKTQSGHRQTLTRIAALEDRLRKKQAELDECAKGFRLLKTELGRQTELTRSLAARLQQVTSAPLDLCNVQKKLDHFKAELSTGQVDGFYCHIQVVIDYLRNNDGNTVTIDTRVFDHRADQLDHRADQLDHRFDRCNRPLETPRINIELHVPRTRDDVTRPQQEKKDKMRNAKLPRISSSKPRARRPSPATRPKSCNNSMRNRPGSDQANCIEYFYNKQSLPKKPQPRECLLTPPPL